MEKPDTTWHNYHEHIASIEDVKKMYGMVMRLENICSSENHDTLGNIDLIENDNKLGKKRFQVLFDRLIPSNEELRKLIKLANDCFESEWEPSTTNSYDETIFAYQPSEETKKYFETNFDPIPVAYLPNKPHPNGLLSYNLSSISVKTGRAYVYNIDPVIEMHFQGLKKN